MQVTKIYFADAPSKHNKNLTDYLDDNINDIIINGHISLKFIIATKKVIIELKKKNIKKLPAVINGSTIIVEVPAIKRYFNRQISQNKPPIPPKSADEELHEYMMNNMMADGDNDPEDNISPANKFNDYTSRKKAVSRPPPSAAHNGLTAGSQDDPAESLQESLPSRNYESNIKHESPIDVINSRTAFSDEDRRDDDMMSALLEKNGQYN